MISGSCWLGSEGERVGDAGFDAPEPGQMSSVSAFVWALTHATQSLKKRLKRSWVEVLPIQSQKTQKLHLT
jgi:hypothetical protein